LWLKNLALACVSLALFLASAEGLCRLKYDPKEPEHSGIFEYDKDKVYRLKKNLRGWRFAGRPVRTNSHGFRDTEISVAKPAGTRRILALGDSVTFGHGVLGRQSFPELLEDRLDEILAPQHFDVINTGVPGNASFQEYFDLKRGLIFDPDVAILQFELNDLVEPYIVLERYGGTGLDYHDVVDVPHWHYLLSQHSALYLATRDAIMRIRYGGISKEALQKQAEGKENNLAWNAGAYPPNDDKIREAWRETLEWMQKSFDLCKEEKIECILLLSPIQLQFKDPEKSYAQARLTEFARENDVPSIDMLPLLVDLAAAEIRSQHGLAEAVDWSHLVATYPEDVDAQWETYFLDATHYTPKGHRLVSEVLLPAVQEALNRNEPGREQGG